MLSNFLLAAHASDAYVMNCVRVLKKKQINKMLSKEDRIILITGLRVQKR